MRPGINANGARLSDCQDCTQMTDDWIDDIIKGFKPSENGVSLDFTSLDQSLLDALNLSGDILSLFDNDERYAVKIKVGQTQLDRNGNPVNAQTGRASSGTMSVITFNPDYLNRATDLAIARTAIHELVHAYLQYIIQHVPNSELGTTLDSLIFQHNFWLIPGEPQHVLMAEQFVSAIALSLSNSDGFQHAAIEYQRLTWSGGMRESATYEQIPQGERNAIIARDQIESGDPRNTLPVSPLGTKSC
ncbi:hypothetical protein [uncultured Nonlabens sp.]|uniref:hypothetical protein n=1 Tax=uncultured Nonlabens sp. TaxID=859306 RepID=UPI002633B74A|nr:hypothetical protein [uncultured Nonlabens sp.]